MLVKLKIIHLVAAVATFASCADDKIGSRGPCCDDYDCAASKLALYDEFFPRLYNQWISDEDFAFKTILCARGLESHYCDTGRAMNLLDDALAKRNLAALIGEKADFLYRYGQCREALGLLRKAQGLTENDKVILDGMLGECKMYKHYHYQRTEVYDFPVNILICLDELGDAKGFDKEVAKLKNDRPDDVEWREIAFNHYCYKQEVGEAINLAAEMMMLGHLPDAEFLMPELVRNGGRFCNANDSGGQEAQLYIVCEQVGSLVWRQC